MRNMASDDSTLDYSHDLSDADYNISDFADYEENEVTLQRVLVPLLFTIIIILGCIGNTIVLIVVIRNRDHFRNTTNLFILNLSVADLLFLLFCVPFHSVIYATNDGNWPFGNLMCKMVHLVQFSSMAGSILTLVAMAGDRYLAVAHAIETKHLRTPNVAFVACVVIWIIALAIALPMPIVYSAQYHPAYGISACADDWGGENHGKHRKTYFLSLFIFFFLIPLIAIFGLSMMIVRQLWLTQQPEGPRMKESILRKRKVTRLIVVVVIVFFICWLPSHIFWLWINFFPQTFKKEYITLRVYAHAFSYANSAVNPVLYAFLSANFRRGFQKAILCRDVQPLPVQRFTFTKMASQNSNGSGGCRRSQQLQCAHYVIPSNSSDACL